MFENRFPFKAMADPARIARGERDAAGSRGAGGGDALRAVAWHELTARLSAARDLRSVLRQDARAMSAIECASFTDAAASYFRALGHGEPAVNPNNIDDPKACAGIDGARKDARAAETAGSDRALLPHAGEGMHDEPMGETHND